MTQQFELFEHPVEHVSSDWPQYVLDYERDLPAIRELTGAAFVAFLDGKSYSEAVRRRKNAIPEEITYLGHGSAELRIELLELPEGVWSWGYWATNHRSEGRMSGPGMGAGRPHLALSREEAIQLARGECADVFGMADLDEVVRCMGKPSRRSKKAEGGE